LYPAEELTLVDRLIRQRPLQEIEPKRLAHKRAFDLDGVMVELFLLHRDDRGLFTVFWGSTRHDWPADVLSSVAALPVASEAALVRARALDGRTTPATTSEDEAAVEAVVVDGAVDRPVHHLPSGLVWPLLVVIGAIEIEGPLLRDAGGARPAHRASGSGETVHVGLAPGHARACGVSDVAGPTCAGVRDVAALFRKGSIRSGPLT
jgi:hypothetical protein